MASVRARIKDAVKARTAARGATNWTVNGSATQGAKMVREFSNLMLRAYDNEADHAAGRGRCLRRRLVMSRYLPGI